MKKLYRFTVLFLAILTVLPLWGVPSISAEEGAVLYSETFDRFMDIAEGTRLTRDDGFSNTIPDTTAVAREGENTYLRVDFASSGDPDKTVYYLKNSSYDLVDAGTEGAIRTDEASYGLISGKDTNIDKNLQLVHPAVSYINHKKVLLEVDYYLSEDANGSIYSQILKYSSAESNWQTATWLNLYNIDPETGALNVASDVKNSGERLVRDAWNTVSMVIDMESGMADYYLNHALYAENASLGHTCISFLADSWIVAKIHRTTTVGHIASEELDGHFGLDNVRIGTIGADMIVSVPSENAIGEKLSEIALYRNGTRVGTNCLQRKFLCTNGWSVAPIYFDGSAYEGVITGTSTAELRTVLPGGLRYVSELDVKKYEALEALKENGTLTDLTFGTMIVPQFWGDAREMLEAATERVKVQATYGAWYSDERAEEDFYSFAGSLANLGSSHYNDAFVGIGYVAATLKSGEVVYYCGDFDRTGASVQDLARTMLESGEPLSNALRSHLMVYLDTPIADVGGTVTEISILDNRLFFRIDEKIYVCLSYTGNDGWRLRAQGENYLGFESAGAAQALASYLGETPNEVCEPLAIDYKDGALVVRSADASYVSIEIGHDFEMRCYNAADEEVVRLTDINIRDGEVVLTGELQDGEAVYGGGQRFDSVNQRGKELRLYANDAWNNSNSTYMVTPLFSTSRGGGFYVNRYEDAVADLGKSVADEWKFSLKNDRMDCYFFATETIKEVIEGYTVLSGSTEMPEEWTYGVMVCRYAYDLTTFDTDNVAVKFDNAPSGYSVKTIVTNLIEAGMKPTAMILEAWGYANISLDTESARTSREELQRTIDWLDERDIKTMLYMIVGGSFNPATAKGWKDEYATKAYVTENGETRYTDKIFSVYMQNGVENPDVAGSSGLRRYLDITNPEAVAWFYDEIWGQLIDMGVDGVKIDFAEEMPDEGYDYGGASVKYDWHDPSVFESGTEHHSYPVYFISSFYKRMNELKAANGETDGFVVLARGGGIGAQHYPFMWAGDQVRSFEKLDDALLANVNSGLSGMPFMSYDMAGYRYSASYGVAYSDPNSLAYESEVFIRAMSYTAFTLNVQTHGTVRNVYELTEDAQNIYRLYLDLRAELTDYITKNMQIACETGVPAVRHPVLEFQDDPNVYSIKDQFLLGDALMVAPILTEGATKRTVYLPKGSWTNLLTGEVVAGGSYDVKLQLGQSALYINNASADAAYLLEIFNRSEAWRGICDLETTPPTMQSEFRDDFERFSDWGAGTYLTDADGFVTPPSSLSVAKEEDNTYVRVDFAAAGDPNKTVYYVKNSAYELVDADTEGAIMTDEASYGLISGNDGNIDKNLRMLHSRIPYERYKSVHLSIDYYISEDANGSIHSQILGYTSAESDFQNANWINLYNVDSETGAFNVSASGGELCSDDRLTRGAWNTVSLEIDLENGAVDYYLNGNLYVKNASLGKTCLTLNAGSWIIGKIHRTTTVGHIASEELGGYFGIDNVLISAEHYEE